MRQLTTAGLFCGAGGLDMGFHNAGFKPVWANDFDKDACATHALWSGADVVCGDIGKIDASAIPDADVLLGGFPCQGFSLSGPRKLDDSRNKLYKHYVRIVKEKQPLAFVGENVKGLLTMGNGGVIDAIISEFSDCGYDVFLKLVNARDFYVPQDRERVIICGFRKDLKVTNFEIKVPEGRHITLREALSGLTQAKRDEICMEPYSSRYMSRNRRRDWNDVSFTIPAMAKQVPLHPSSPCMTKVDTDKWIFGDGETRRFSYREAAVIQTFPEGMEFTGNLTSKYKQIGNAVPVKLAECVAKQLLEVIR